MRGVPGRPTRADDTPDATVAVAYGDAAEAVLILEALANALRTRAEGTQYPNSPASANQLADQIERTAKDLAKPLGQRMDEDRQVAAGSWTRDLHGMLPP